MIIVAIIIIAAIVYLAEPKVAQVFDMSQRLNAVEIGKLASNAGFSGSDLIIAIAIALAESGGKPDAVGDKDLAPEKGPSIGLWQINIGTKAHALEYSEDELKDPQSNADAAHDIYAAAGNRFRDWSTFIHGNYQTYIDEVKSVINV